MKHDAMAISQGRGSVRRRSRGSDPRDSFDERRKTYASDFVRSDDGASSVSSPRQDRRQKVRHYLKTHIPLCWYVVFVAFAEVVTLLIP